MIGACFVVTEAFPLSRCVERAPGRGGHDTDARGALNGGSHAR